MGIGITANNAVPLQGSSWEDLFGIDVDSLTNITRANFFVEVIGNDQHTWIEALYIGTVGLSTATLTELIDLPKGSIIHAPVQASGTPSTGTIFYKTGVAGTDTWKYDAINT